MGIVAYAFRANSKVTRHRPPDEHRFQLKYGAKVGGFHEIWQDPFDLYTTLLLGIDPDSGFFVAIDPVLHNPTRMFVSFEFKQEQVDQIQALGWHCWERQKTARGIDTPVETVVGGTAEKFLDYIRFEQAAKFLDQGHRYLIAEKIGHSDTNFRAVRGALPEDLPTPPRDAVHSLAEEFELDANQILSLIEDAPRLKMAVRGWVAEAHLAKILEGNPVIRSIRKFEQDGQPDFALKLHNRQEVKIECKNVLRRPMADGTIRVDFQKTRASKADPCSRFYQPSEFQILAACLHPATEMWEFRFQQTKHLAPHVKCPGRLDNKVRVTDDWPRDIEDALEAL